MDPVQPFSGSAICRPGQCQVANRQAGRGSARSIGDQAAIVCGQCQPDQTLDAVGRCIPTALINYRASRPRPTSTQSVSDTLGRERAPINQMQAVPEQINAAASRRSSSLANPGTTKSWQSFIREGGPSTWSPLIERTQSPRPILSAICSAEPDRRLNASSIASLPVVIFNGGSSWTEANWIARSVHRRPIGFLCGCRSGNRPNWAANASNSLRVLARRASWSAAIDRTSCRQLIPRARARIAQRNGRPRASARDGGTHAQPHTRPRHFVCSPAHARETLVVAAVSAITFAALATLETPTVPISRPHDGVIAPQPHSNSRAANSTSLVDCPDALRDPLGRLSA